MLWFGGLEVKFHTWLGAPFHHLKSHVYRKYIEFAILTGLAVALLWWFGRKVDWVEVRHAVRHSNPYLLVAAALVISLVYVLRAFRWGALLKPLVGARISDLVVATVVGFAAVFLVGRAGEVVRPVVLPMRDPKVRPSASFVTIMVERIYDMVAIVLMFAINLIWFKPASSAVADMSRVRSAGLILLIGVVLGVIALAWFRKRSDTVIAFVTRIFEKLGFIPDRLTKLVLRLLEQLAQALRVLVNFSELAQTVGWTAILWIDIVIANLLIIRAFGLNFGLSETIFVLGWALAGSLVPTPGGAAGAFHAATATGFLILGLDRDTAAAVSIVMHLIDFGPALIFGLFFLLRGDLNLSRLRTLVSSEAVEHAVEDEKAVPDEILNRAQPDTVGD